MGIDYIHAIVVKVQVAIVASKMFLKRLRC